MSLNIAPYELSIWDIISTDNKFQERKNRVIGSNNMTSRGRAHNIVITKKINGDYTITFDIIKSYFDEEEGELVDNPIIPMLVNERLLKLKYKDKWYEVTIDSCDESSSNTYSYSASALHIKQLSRTGYNLEFTNELENNLGTATELGRKVLVDTDWVVEEGDFLQQHKVENLFELTLGEDTDFCLIKKNERTIEQEWITIPALSIVYAFYSDIDNKNERVQILYREDGNYKIDEDRVITNANNYYRDGVSYNGDIPYFANNIALEISLQFKGEKIIQNQKTAYSQSLQQIVNVYEDYSGNEVYGYTKTIYDVPDLVKNIVVNSSKFGTTSGWTANLVKYNGPSQEFVLIDKPNHDFINVEYTSNKSLLKAPLSTIANGNYINTFLHFDASSLGITNTQLSGTTDGRRVIAYNKGIVSNKNIIGGFAKGERYVLKYKLQYPKTGSYVGTTKGINAFIAKRLPNGLPDKRDNAVFLFTESNGDIIDDGNTFSSTIITTCRQSISEEELENYGLFLQFRSTSICLEEIQLFKLMRDANNEIILPDSSQTQMLNDAFKVQYCYFDPEANKGKTEEEVIYLQKVYESPSPSYQPKIDISGEQIRTISGSKSNRFNFIQSINEMFECWSQFDIEHDAIGNVTKKTLRFKKYIGKDNYSGFRRGINLDSTSRVLNSSNLVTKLYVEDNANEFATNGFCSITRAVDNPLRSNDIYNFDHYIRAGILDYETVQKDLNDLYINGGALRKKIQQNTDLLVQYEASRLELESKVTTYQALLDEGTQAFNDACDALETYKGKKYSEYTNINLDSISDNALLKYLSTANNIAYQKVENGKMMAKYAPQLGQVEYKIKLLKEENTELLNEYKELENSFLNKYANFILEGTWIDENYMDDDLYFLDALSVSYTSSLPETSYTLKVIDISTVEDFENYAIDCGDKSYIEDTDLFGWTTINGLKTPYKLDVVVTEMKEHLEAPEKNEVTIENYRNQFESLFQRISATVQNVEYRSGAYERASKAVTPTGEIEYDSLQKCFDNNAVILSNAEDQSVEWGNKGITIKNLAKAQEMLRAVAGGIFLSQDGGATWTAGITAAGINTSLLTAGVINADKINIVSGGKPTFTWNKYGINAFKWANSQGNPTASDAKVWYNQFVRFDQFGLWGYYEPEEAGIDYSLKEPFNPSVTSAIMGNPYVLFALTWEGLKISTKSGGFKVDENGFLLKNMSTGEEVLKADYKGNLSITGVINALAGGTIGDWKITNYGITYYDDYDTATIYLNPESGLVFKRRSENGTYSTPLHINAEGKIVATDAVISGTIKANNGNIGIWNITTTGLSSGDGKLYFNPNSGIVFKDDNGKVIFQVNNAGEVTAKSGKIGGVTLKDGYCYAGNIPNGGSSSAPSNTSFAIYNDGSLVASKGFIGGWNITTEGLSTDDNKIYLNSNTGTGLLKGVYCSLDAGVSIVGLGDISSYGGYGGIGVVFRQVTSGQGAFTGYISASTEGISVYPGIVSPTVNALDINNDSDFRLKNTIAPLSDKYLSLLDKIESKSFYLNKSQRNSKYLGFIAQDVVAALNEAGLDTSDFASVSQNSDGYYSLNYIQFIPILWEAVKCLSNRVSELENLTKQQKYSIIK